MLLSIAIPTYNRAALLEAELQCLVPQLTGLDNQVELIISDNCSPDHTQSVVGSFIRATTFPIKYIRQIKNIGGEANNTFLLNECKGQYILLLGDDDLLSPNIVRIVLDYLNENKEISILHWNRLVGDNRCDNNYLFNKHNTGLVKCEPFSEFIREHMVEPSFMSSLVFNRKCWDLGGEIDLSKFIGYMWFGRILWGAYKSGLKTVYYYMPLSIQGGGNSSYRREWPLYLIVGLSEIFRKLDTVINGIYQEWQDMLYDEFRVRDVILTMVRDQAYYRNYENEIRSCLRSKDKTYLHYWLHTKCAKMQASVFYRISRLFKG